MIVKEKIKGLFQQAELVIFFFFLITSLFLGDGKQAFVDAWWALGILMMYGVRYYQRGKLDLRPLPRPIGFAWTGFILYYIILTPFSDSAGYSITATIRLIEAYLVYVMFYTISPEKTVRLFTWGFLFIGVVATLSSFVFLLVPSWASFLPPMNLLYATYGHNHLADLLLPAFPLLIAQLQHKQSKLLWLLLILFTVGMVLTFARGAWILLVVYLLFLVWRSKNVTTRRVGLSVAAVIVATFLLVQKTPLLADGRWEYWRQATQAIKERPFFGSGPGTFYLESKRLQAAPSSYSWFTHSFPLQLVVETGAVGFLIFGFLFYFLFRRIQTASPLLPGAALVLAYSFYEFTLDYISMWLLVWAALGVLTKDNVQRSTHSKTAIGALVVLALFYISNIGSLGASVLGNKTLTFFLAPYNESAAKDWPSSFAVSFHKKNPEVLFAIGEPGCEQVMALDRHNQNLQQECLRMLLESGKTKNAAAALYLLGKTILPKTLWWRLSLGDLTSDAAIKHISQKLLQDTLYSADQKDDGYAKLMYYLGLQAINEDPLLTRRLWVLARDISPGWSYYHVELASLEMWVLNDASSAKRRLARCAERKDPRAHCLYILTHTVPSVGSQKDFIAAIPKNL